jgi:hypothetical protein
MNLLAPSGGPWVKTKVRAQKGRVTSACWNQVVRIPCNVEIKPYHCENGESPTCLCGNRKGVSRLQIYNRL